MVEPSGVSYEYFGCAAGKGRQPAKTEMEKLALNKTDNSDNVDVREGVKKLARIIYSLHEEGKDKPFELEMSWLCEESDWKHKGLPKDFIKEAVEWAKKDIAEAEEGGEMMEMKRWKSRNVGPTINVENRHCGKLNNKYIISSSQVLKL